MTLLEIPAESPREKSTPVLETERLILRAPTLGDAKTIAKLANDRRIAENTARIPHPYGDRGRKTIHHVGERNARRDRVSDHAR